MPSSRSAHVLLWMTLGGCTQSVDVDSAKGYFTISACRADALELGGVVWVRPRGFEVADPDRWLSWCEERRRDGSVVVVHTEVDHILVHKNGETTSVESGYSIHGAGTKRWDGPGEDGVSEGVLKLSLIHI